MQDSNIQYIDWTKIQQKYAGKWVAFKDDEKSVISTGNTATAALEKARKQGFREPILSKMPKRVVPYIGSV